MLLACAQLLRRQCGASCPRLLLAAVFSGSDWNCSQAQITCTTTRTDYCKLNHATLRWKSHVDTFRTQWSIPCTRSRTANIYGFMLLPASLRWLIVVHSFLRPFSFAPCCVLQSPSACLLCWIFTSFLVIKGHECTCSTSEVKSATHPVQWTMTSVGAPVCLMVSITTANINVSKPVSFQCKTWQWDPELAMTAENLRSNSIMFERVVKSIEFRDKIVSGRGDTF